MPLPLKVLFLCTGNSARSILAEYLLRSLGGERFAAWSAGSRPRGEVHPLALSLLRERYGLAPQDARSKSWEELRALPFDLVVTVCDQARESCPLWPGAPAVAHWGLPDPAAAEGDEPARLGAFVAAAAALEEKLRRLVALPVERLGPAELQDHLRALSAAPPPHSPQNRGTINSATSRTSRVRPAPSRGKSKKR